MALYAIDSNGNRKKVAGHGGGVVKGDPGGTFIPSVSSDGVLSWSNTSGLSNPNPVNIKGVQGERGLQGEKGEKGEKGDTGPQGEKGDKGDTGVQGPQGPAGKDGVTIEQVNAAIQAAVQTAVQDSWEGSY